jgi:broad-specificity NMP kinase
MVVITGAPGVGKSSLAKALDARIPGVLVLDGDITARKDMQSDYRLVRAWLRNWLECGVHVSDSGRTLMLAVFVRPRELEDLDEYSGLDEVIYVALSANATELAARLRERPKSEGISPEEVASLISLDREIREIAEADTRVFLVDSSGMTLDETAEVVERALVERLGSTVAD